MGFVPIKGWVFLQSGAVGRKEYEFTCHLQLCYKPPLQAGSKLNPRTRSGGRIERPLVCT